MPLHSVWSRPRRRRRIGTAATTLRPAGRALGTAAVAAGAIAAASWYWWPRGTGNDSPQGPFARQKGDDVAASPGLPSFVGREAELRVLAALTEQQRPFIPHRRVVVLRGPRAGKSRLLREHARRAQLAEPERLVALVDFRAVPLDPRGGNESRGDEAWWGAAVQQLQAAVAVTNLEDSSSQSSWRWFGANREHKQLTVQLQDLARKQDPNAKLPLLILDQMPLVPPQLDAASLSRGLPTPAVELLRSLETIAAAGLACVVICPCDTTTSSDPTAATVAGQVAVRLDHSQLLWLGPLPTEDAESLSAAMAEYSSDGVAEGAGAVPEALPPPPLAVTAAAASRFPTEMAQLLLAAGGGVRGDGGDESAKDEPDTDSPPSPLVTAPTLEAIVEARVQLILRAMGLSTSPSGTSGGPLKGADEGDREYAGVTEMLASSTDTTATASAATARCVSIWRLLCDLANESPTGEEDATSVSTSIGPELLERLGSSGLPSVKPGATIAWDELCVRLLSGAVGVEAVVRQDLGVAVQPSGAEIEATWALAAVLLQGYAHEDAAAGGCPGGGALTLYAPHDEFVQPTTATGTSADGTDTAPSAENETAPLDDHERLSRGTANEDTLNSGGFTTGGWGGLPPEAAHPRWGYGAGWRAGLGLISRLAVAKVAREIRACHARDQSNYYRRASSPDGVHGSEKQSDGGQQDEDEGWRVEVEVLYLLLRRFEQEVAEWHYTIEMHAVEGEGELVMAEAEAERALAKAIAEDGNEHPPWGERATAALCDLDAARQRRRIAATELQARAARQGEAAEWQREREKALQRRLLQQPALQGDDSRSTDTEKANRVET